MRDSADSSAESPAAVPQAAEGAASVHQGLTTSPDPDPQLWQSLRPWQRRIVALVASGVPVRLAAEQQQVSWASMDQYTRDGGPFAAALTEAEAAVALAGVEAVRDLAVAHAGGMVLDAVSASRTEERGADRLGNRRLVLEVAGAVGQSARVQVQVHVAQLQAPSGPGMRQFLGSAPAPATNDARVLPDTQDTQEPDSTDP